MHRHAVGLVFLLAGLSAVAQTTQSAQPNNSSDPAAVSLVQQSLAAFGRGTAVSDVTINANVISFVGPDTFSGTGTFSVKASGQSRIDLNLNGNTLSEVRSINNGTQVGAWARNGATAQATAQHNNWTDAAWFCPVLSYLAQTSSAGFVVKYIGQEQYAGSNVQHIQVFQAPTWAPLVQRLSTTDVYLDAKTFLPLAMAFTTHADQDVNINIPVVIQFANYQTANGVLFPFHIQRIQGGILSLDVTVTNVSLNTGLQSSMFTLQ